MNFNLNAEEIDGYYVDEKKKKIWEIELEMLKQLNLDPDISYLEWYRQNK